MKRVLVTGAAGYVGRWTLKHLRDAAFELHGVARNARDDPGVTWHRADLLAGGGAALIDAVRPTHLLHLAWTTEHGKFWSDPANETWLGASLDLADSFARAGGRRMITIGTCAEYRWTDAALSEQSVCEPATPYGRAKLALYERVGALAARYGVAHAHARIFFSYGPGEQPGRLVPSVARALRAGESVEIANGAAVRDFIDVRELGRGIAALAASDATGPVNVASGEGVTLRAVAETLARLTGTDPALLRFAEGGAADRIVADVTRLTREVGFRNVVSLEAGLAHALAAPRAPAA
jgi:nucleoside-diphosphate-sugar epimerase